MPDTSIGNKSDLLPAMSIEIVNAFLRDYLGRPQGPETTALAERLVRGELRLTVAVDNEGPGSDATLDLPTILDLLGSNVPINVADYSLTEPKIAGNL